MEILYKDEGYQIYQPDFICFDKIILEIKVVSKLTDEHRAQAHKPHVSIKRCELLGMQPTNGRLITDSTNIGVDDTR